MQANQSEEQASTWLEETKSDVVGNISNNDDERVNTDESPDAKICEEETKLPFEVLPSIKP